MGNFPLQALPIPLTQAAHRHPSRAFSHPQFGCQGGLRLRITAADHARFQRMEQRPLAVTRIVLAQKV
jgi:hypothetical protein